MTLIAQGQSGDYSQYSFALLGASNRRDFLTRGGEDRYYQAHDPAAWARDAMPLWRAASDFARGLRSRFGMVQAYARSQLPRAWLVGRP